MFPDVSQKSDDIHLVGPVRVVHNKRRITATLEVQLTTGLIPNFIDKLTDLSF